MKRKRSWVFVLVVLSFGLTKCSISIPQLSGVYLNPKFSDTLHLRPDHTYEYVEKLNNGARGWTDGKWFLQNHKVLFQCDHKPLVGYRRTIQPDNTVHIFQLKFLLSDTDAPIYVEEVKLFKAKQPLSDKTFSKENNIVKIFSKDFDSIAISTIYFRTITITSGLSTDQGNTVRIYPAERLYALDKVSFRFKENKLTSTRTKRSNITSISFEKLNKR